MFVNQLKAKGISVDLRKCIFFVSKDHSELATPADRVGEVVGESIVIELRYLCASTVLSPIVAVGQKQKDSKLTFQMNNKNIVLREQYKYNGNHRMSSCIFCDIHKLKCSCGMDKS